MKDSAGFLITKLFILAAGNLLLAACGELEPRNQNANLPQNQNTNITILESKTPTPSSNPAEEISNITAGTTPSPAPTLAITNITPNINAPVPNVNLSNGNADSSNKTFDVVAVDKLLIPVSGVKREELRDTFKDARSEGRVHDAIDIMAPQGAPVLAAADGEIVKFFDSVRGGITIYQYSRDKKLIYYYAHLQRRADGLQEHQFVRQGTVIGYVGDTGNSGTGNFHLHFAIWAITDPKRYWDGTNINPYPLLR